MNVLLLWLAFIGLWSAVAWAAKSFHWQAESSRKAIHTGMGLVCACFPWFFSHPWEVWMLAILCVIPLAGARVFPNGFPKAMSAALNRVTRRSWGELLFAPSVALAFTFGHQNRPLFTACILLLALADAAGALVGKRWGANGYATMSTRKSVEGSLAVMISGGLVVFLVLWIAAVAPIGNCLFIAMVAGCLVGMIEAVADSGFDNLTIPVGMFLILDRLIVLDLGDLIARLAVLGFLAITLLLSARRSTLDGGALLAGCLLLYACHALGGWLFFLPPLMVFLFHLRACIRWQLHLRMHHGVISVASLGLPVMLWLIVNATEMMPQRASLQAVAWSCAVFLALAMSATKWKMTSQRNFWTPCMKAVAVCILPLWVLGEFPGWLNFSVGFAVSLASVYFGARVPQAEQSYEYSWRAASALLTSCTVFLS
ncbi:MAG: hypothetical protein EAZ42_01910 [Verrucomicrobia bacterium]|nr:MAG: hypothetical protein EAZ42_01910 [Verrucomicrobiota bacterium]